MAGSTGGRIVVGVDGSTPSKAALAWALEEARLRDASVQVVHAWQFPAVGLTTFGAAALPVIAPEDLEHAAEETVQQMLAAVADRAKAVEVTSSVERGHPAEALVAAAKGADLLVVGSRGHGGFTGMLLGSVSSHVVHHATCPVVVVRGEED